MQKEFVILLLIRQFTNTDQVISKVKKRKMAKKLFVGNLAYTMTDADLMQIFSAFGKVISANIVIDKFNQRSKGFGFVEYETEEEAKAAIAALDGSDQGGRNIAVKEALPRPDRPQM